MAKPFDTVSHSRAKKEYKCDKCGAKITPKELYERHWGMNEQGEMYNRKYCVRCMEKAPEEN